MGPLGIFCLGDPLTFALHACWLERSQWKISISLSEDQSGCKDDVTGLWQVETHAFPLEKGWWLFPKIRTKKVTFPHKNPILGILDGHFTLFFAPFHGRHAMEKTKSGNDISVAAIVKSLPRHRCPGVSSWSACAMANTHYMVDGHPNHKDLLTMSIDHIWMNLLDLEVSIVMGVPQTRWMVYFMEIPTKMDENWGYPYFRKPPFGLRCIEISWDSDILDIGLANSL